MNTVAKLPASASPVWSLGALVAASAAWWIWLQIPAWAFLSSADETQLRVAQQVCFHPGLLSMLLVLTNAVVLRWVTLPMALPQMEQSGPINQTQYWKHDLVFWLGTLFHLTSLVAAGWWGWQVWEAN